MRRIAIVVALVAAMTAGFATAAQAAAENLVWVEGGTMMYAQPGTVASGRFPSDCLRTGRPAPVWSSDIS